MRCVIVDMRTHLFEANRVNRPTIAHVPTGIVHKLTRSKGGFEKVPARGPGLQTGSPRLTRTDCDALFGSR